MADTLIEGSASSFIYTDAYANGGPFWISPTSGAILYVNSSGALVARKTTNGGTSWGSASAVEAGTVKVHAAWFDQQTPNDSGTKIHVVWVDSAPDLVRYAAYDISAGTWSTPLTLQDPYPYATVGRENGGVFIGKTRSGNLLAGWSVAAPACHRSTDGGATWTSRSSPWESNSVDHVLFTCPNTGDGADGALVFWDVSANELSVKMYDDSANSWTETVVASSMAASITLQQFALATRHSDGHTILAAWNAVDSVTADLKAWDLTLTTISSVGVSALADVITDTSEAATVGVFIDQNTDDIYVAYLRGTAWNSLTGAFYKVSTTDGSSWGSQTALSEDAEDDNRFISAGAASPTAGGRFQPWWFDDDDNDIFNNLNTDIQFDPPPTSGIGALMLWAPVAAGVGDAPHVGTSGITLWVPDLAATAKQLQSATGTLDLWVPDLSGTGEQVDNGDGALNLWVPDLSGAGEQVGNPIGDGALNLWVPELSGDGTHTDVQGSGGLNLWVPTIFGIGGGVNQGTSAMQLWAPEFSAVGNMVPVGTGQLLLPTPDLSGSGKQVLSGTGSIILWVPDAAGSGTHTDIQGTGAFALWPPEMAGSGVTIGGSGTGELDLWVPDLSGSGYLVPEGVGALSLWVPDFLGSGKSITSGTGALILAVPVMSAEGGSFYIFYRVTQLRSAWSPGSMRSSWLLGAIASSWPSYHIKTPGG